MKHSTERCYLVRVEARAEQADVNARAPVALRSVRTLDPTPPSSSSWLSSALSSVFPGSPPYRFAITIDSVTHGTFQGQPLPVAPALLNALKEGRATVQFFTHGAQCLQHASGLASPCAHLFAPGNASGELHLPQAAPPLEASALSSTLNTLATTLVLRLDLLTKEQESHGRDIAALKRQMDLFAQKQTQQQESQVLARLDVQKQETQIAQATALGEAVRRANEDIARVQAKINGVPTSRL